jgi:hypothetical protein
MKVSNRRNAGPGGRRPQKMARSYHGARGASIGTESDVAIARKKAEERPLPQKAKPQCALGHHQNALLENASFDNRQPLLSSRHAQDAVAVFAPGLLPKIRKMQDRTPRRASVVKADVGDRPPLAIGLGLPTLTFVTHHGGPTCGFPGAG